MTFFTKEKAMSPNWQDFIWVAEYTDATYLSEFNFNNTEENSFYAIKKDQLLKFGLIGHGMPFSFSCVDGTFRLIDLDIQVFYKEDNKVYEFMGQNNYYNDIITFKDAYASFSLGREGDMKSTIFKYSFGYKTTFQFEDVKFSFKAICEVPMEDRVKMNFWLVSDKEMNGEFYIRRNNKVHGKLDAPLTSNMGGFLSWTVE